MRKKDITAYVILIVVVIGIILIINYVRGNGSGNEVTIQCIAENSLLVVKEGCPACASQKNLLEGYLDKFDMIDCSVEPEKCMDFGITHVPTWIINNEKYKGVHSIERLTELTGC